MLDLKALAAGLAPLIKQLVSREVGAVEKRVDTLAERIDTLPTPKDGQNGKDADPVEVKALIEAAVAQIPTPKDGASVTIDEVTPLIEERVKAAVAEIPAPAAGKDADPALVAELVSVAVAKLPAPADGKSVTVEELAPLVTAEVSKAVAAIPVPKDGQNGAAGKDAEPLDKDAIVQEVAALIPRPQDGKSVTAEEVEPMLAGMLEKAVAALPKPKDGESVPVDQVQRMIDEAVTKAMNAVPVPKDGEHGRDAAEIEIMPAINESRRYARGTYASHKGGLWRAMRSTDGLDGWECIVEGLAQVSVEQHPENPRKFLVNLSTSGGRQEVKEFSMPVVLYRGIFKEGDAYEAGDSVTWGGSTWIALQDTGSKPDSVDGTWRLAVKRGSPGKDAMPTKIGGPSK